MKKLLILTLFLSNTLLAQSIKIRVHCNNFNDHLYDLTCDDSATAIHIAEEEGVDSAFVMKLSYEKLLITMRHEDHEVQYIFYDRYIQGIVRYYPTKTLFYDKNNKLYNPKTCD